MPTENGQSELIKELLDEDRERVRREHPDVEEQFRQYRRDWDTFRKSVGAPAESAGPTKRYRA
jgi:hypothetical protein